MPRKYPCQRLTPTPNMFISLQALVQLLLRHADSCGPAELAECAAALTRLGVWDTLGPASSPATPSLRPGPAMQPVVRGAPSPEQQLQLLLRRMAACAKCRGFLDSASEAGVVLLLWCYSKASAVQWLLACKWLDHAEHTGAKQQNGMAL